MSVLQVDNLSRSYKDNKAVNDISFSVNPGEIVGFIGPNGSGKTTTLKCILDLIRRDAGEIKINGFSVPKERVKALSHTGCWMDISYLYYDLTAADHINFVQQTRNIPKETVARYIKFFDISGYLKLKVHKYSYGMRQRLGLALAAMTEPALLILDEPTNGLDPVGVLAFREVLLRLVKENNTAIFFSSHVLSELEKVVDKALFIKKGIIVHTEVNKSGHVYRVKVSDRAKALSLLAALDVNARLDEEYITFTDSKLIDAVMSAFYANGISVLDMEKTEDNLEKIFYSLYEDDGDV